MYRMGFRYIGSKVRIAEDIIEHLGCPDAMSGHFVDAFAGTGAVASVAADRGWRVRINDMLLSATTIATSRLMSSCEARFAKLGGYANTCEMLNNAPAANGYYWQVYSPASCNFCDIERRYFTEENAKRIDGARNQIVDWYENKKINDGEKSLLYATLINAMNSVANIAGTYGCFISHWTSQAKGVLEISPLSLRTQKVEYSASNLDVMNVETSQNDVVYLDPPYTKRQYASYYHIIETLVQEDNPIVSGIAGLRPWKDKASVFCYKTKALEALVALVASLKAKRVLLSYSDEGHVKLNDLSDRLSSLGSVQIVDLGEIGRYRPNRTAGAGRANVNEFLIDFRRDGGGL